jgi:hypothetical protein
LIQFGEDLGEVVVVGEDKVSEYTAKGYQLKAVVSETIPQMVFPTRGHLNPPSVPGAMGMITTSSDTEYIPQVVAKYILGLPKDETAKRHFEDHARLSRENQDLTEKNKLLEKQLQEALKACKAFAEEREAFEKKATADMLLLEARVKALTENSRNTLADLKRLSEHSDPLQRIMSLEDWILGLCKVVDVQSFGLTSPVSSPKTWAERLVEDDTDL